jgi:protein-tyrosine phosphatase
MMFHCTAGKDRTGFGAAIIMLALGVPKETIMEDYLATNIYTHDRIERTLLIVKVASFFQTDTEALRPILGVEAVFLEEAFNAIEDHYGSTDNYLKLGLGLDEDKLQQLRDLLTEEA